MKRSHMMRSRCAAPAGCAALLAFARVPSVPAPAEAPETAEALRDLPTGVTGPLPSAPLRLLRLLPAALALLASPAAAAAPAGDVAVKAAFLTKFPAYVAWPAAARPRPGAALHICILGDDPFGRLIDEAARGQQVDGHPLQVRRLGASGPAGGCHVLFVQGAAPALLQELQGKPVLTVTDAGAGGQSGMIHFVIHRGRVRFNIDEAQAARSRVGISSRLLRIALSVRRP